MLNKISETFHAWAKDRWVFLMFLADLLMMGYIMPVAGGIMALAANNSVMPLDLMFFYTPERAFEMIEKYGKAGRAIYLKIELTADIIYPIIYTFPGEGCNWVNTSLQSNTEQLSKESSIHNQSGYLIYFYKVLRGQHPHGRGEHRNGY